MITIGITTFNRLNLMKAMAQSLYESALPDNHSIRIYDDASTDYSMDTLRNIFPNAASLHRNQKNLGADLNTFSMYQDFLNSNDEYFFNADSDLLFSREWLSKALALLPKTDGVLSLFNTPSHQIKQELGDLCIKDDLGAAGTLFTRKRIEDICNGMGRNSNEFSISKLGIDYAWSRYFQSKEIRLFCTKDSLVQHIGVWGQNSTQGFFDFGAGFKIDTFHNGQSINDLLEGFSSVRFSDIPLHMYQLFPFKKLNADAKIVLYGAGQIGAAYYKLIKRSGYCRIVAWADKNYNQQRGLISPDAIKNYSFDYILLATSKPTLAASMREDIAAINPSLCSKIVTNDFE